MAGIVGPLIARYPLISDQVSKEQIKTILQELDGVIDRGVMGAIVEFGCYIGTTSLFISRLLDALDKTRQFHVYDSFQGLPQKTELDNSAAGEQFTAGELAVSKKQFMQEFLKARLAPPVVHKAWFHDLTPSDIPDEIALAFLDGDFYTSIRDSLRLVVPRTRKGGVIIIDDYAREALPGVARAVHEYFSAEQIIINHNLGIIRL